MSLKRWRHRCHASLKKPACCNECAGRLGGLTCSLVDAVKHAADLTKSLYMTHIQSFVLYTVKDKTQRQWKDVEVKCSAADSLSLIHGCNSASLTSCVIEGLEEKAHFHTFMLLPSIYFQSFISWSLLANGMLLVQYMLPCPPVPRMRKNLPDRSVWPEKIFPGKGGGCNIHAAIMMQSCLPVRPRIHTHYRYCGYNTARTLWGGLD